MASNVGRRSPYKIVPISCLLLYITKRLPASIRVANGVKKEAIKGNCAHVKLAIYGRAADITKFALTPDQVGEVA